MVIKNIMSLTIKKVFDLNALTLSEKQLITVIARTKAKELRGLLNKRYARTKNLNRKK